MSNLKLHQARKKIFFFNFNNFIKIKKIVKSNKKRDGNFKYKNFLFH